MAETNGLSSSHVCDYLYPSQFASLQFFLEFLRHHPPGQLCMEFFFSNAHVFCRVCVPCHAPPPPVRSVIVYGEW